MREFLLLSHPTTAALAILCALWFLVEAFNASERNRGRLRLSATLSALFMLATWVLAGYWYVVYYPADKAIILASAWPFAHNLFMESKEHAFFITLVLSLYLWVVATRENLAQNATARKLALWTATMVIVSAFAIEGAGSVISMAVRVGLMGAGAH
jgi:hypothetical protein